MSESSRARSSASTWMLTRYVDCDVGAHSTSRTPLGLGLQGRRVGAVLPVHRHPAALGDEAEDRVRRHGRAALGELDPDVLDALDEDAGVTAGGHLGAAAPTRDRDALGQVLGRAVVTAVQVDDAAYDGLGADVALADGGVERGDVDELEVLGHQRERLVRHHPLEGHALLAHELDDLVLALLDRLLAPLLGEVLPDLRARALRLDEGQPVA